MFEFSLEVTIKNGVNIVLLSLNLLSKSAKTLFARDISLIGNVIVFWRNWFKLGLSEADGLSALKHSKM